MRSAALLAALTALPAGVALQQAHAGEAGLVPIPAFTPQQLAAAPRDGWYTNGGSLSNQRYSPLDQINRTNVSGLKAVWRASLEGSGLNPRDGNQAQPLVYDGVVYIMTGEGDTFAVDFETGKALWEFKARVDPRVARPCCSWPGRGVAIGDGKVFVGRNDGRLTALDSSNGRLLWQFQTDGGVNAPPSVFSHDGKEYVVVLAGGTALAGSKRSDGLWLFALDGKIFSLPPGSADPAGFRSRPRSARPSTRSSCGISPATCCGSPPSIDLAGALRLLRLLCEDVEHVGRHVVQLVCRIGRGE